MTKEKVVFIFKVDEFISDIDEMKDKLNHSALNLSSGLEKVNKYMKIYPSKHLLLVIIELRDFKDNNISCLVRAFMGLKGSYIMNFIPLLYKNNSFFVYGLPENNYFKSKLIQQKFLHPENNNFGIVELNINKNIYEERKLHSFLNTFAENYILNNR